MIPRHLTLLRGWMVHIIPRKYDVDAHASNLWAIIAKSYEPSEEALKAAQDALWEEGHWVLTPVIKQAIMAAIGEDGAAKLVERE